MSILIRDGSVTLAHVVRERDVLPELRSLDSFALDNGEVETLRRLRAALQLKTYACTSLMAVGECLVTQLDAPPVPKAERKEAVRWALKEMVNYPLDTACIEVLDVPGDGLPPGRSPGILVVSAAEQAVRARVAPFENAKIRLDALNVPELAQRNVAASLFSVSMKTE